MPRCRHSPVDPRIHRGLPDAPDAQAAFEAAGGLDAWQAMFEAYADLAPHRPASVDPCPGIPISPLVRVQGSWAAGAVAGCRPNGTGVVARTAGTLGLIGDISMT